MKRYIIILLCSLFYTTLLHAQQYISLCEDSTACTCDGLPSRSIEYEGNNIIITYTFDSAIVSEDPLFPNCHIWEYKGFGLIDIAGKPSLPVRRDAFTLSQYTSIDIIDTSYIEIPITLAPARPPLIDNSYSTHTIESVDTITPYEGFFPDNILKTEEIEYYKEKGLLWVNIFPLQYDTENKVVRAYTKIKYKITISDEEKYSSKGIFNNQNHTLIDNIALNKNVSNPNKISVHIEDNQDYLIISTPEFEDVCNRFASWKRTLGYRTHVLIKNNWSEQLVKSNISILYNTLGVNLKYVLFIGDHSHIPPHYVHEGQEFYPTDLYYGCMDGDNDILPDIARGRIPVSNSLEAYNVISKIIKYEKEPIMDSLYYHTGINCAFFEDKNYDGYEDRRFVKSSEDIKQYMELQGKVINRVYYAYSNVNPTNWNSNVFAFGEAIPEELQRPNFNWDGDKFDIINYFNSGAFLIHYRGHGEIENWENPEFGKNDLSNLSSDKTSVFFNITCSTGKYIATSDCFAETLLKKINSGAVGIIAATELSNSGESDAFSLGIFDAIWPEPGLTCTFNDSYYKSLTFREPTYELGRILDLGILKMKETCTNNSFSLYTHEIFHCFGDPSMQLLTETPKQIDPPEIAQIDNKIYVRLTDGNARVSFYNLDTNEVNSYLGNNIEYTATTNNISICISRHNYIPYITKSANSIYIQNETISEDREYNATNIKIGNNVTNKKNQGDVIFNSGTINLNGKNVIFASGTTIRTGTKVNVTQP
ncbi:MAG: hypothetical protein IKY75_07975 [Bacteroidaceae bacterium]|nr:hypothetical protein [Bacteroidaceae bacterium]